MKRILIIATALLTLILMASCAHLEPISADESNKTQQTADSEKAIDSSEEATEDSTAQTEPLPDAAEQKTVFISTSYCELAVTEEFAENVEAVVSSQEPYTVSFSTIADKVELFSLLFGGETENLIGTLILEDKAVVLYAAFNEFDEADDNRETYYGYQEEINTIIQYLISDYGLLVNQAIEWEDQGTFDINTSVVTMKYPTKWQGIVTVDVSEEKVSFSNNGMPLFDLVFSECDGYLLGTYNDTPIYIVEYPVTTDEQATMLEDVNVILQYLMEDPSFDINV